MSVLYALVRSPREGVALALQSGRLVTALLVVAVATAISAVRVLRSASSPQDVMFGPGRSGAVDALLASLGRDLTAVVLHLVESAWAGVLVVTALAPLLVWILGATAIHAAARLVGARRSFRPILVVVGFAVGLTRPPADLAELTLAGTAPGVALSQLIGLVALVWLVLICWHGVRAHYGVRRGQAAVILAVALVLFYLVPLTLALLALVAILVLAVLLEYVPAP